MKQMNYWMLDKYFNKKDAISRYTMTRLGI
jgi:hypothetical protein